VIDVNILFAIRKEGFLSAIIASYSTMMPIEIMSNAQKDGNRKHDLALFFEGKGTPKSY